ncbi:MAG: LysR family transcriptional regulator [Xanthobacteraceae bacterium]
MTAHIRDLEQRLGARLLNRTTGKISLTEVGNAQGPKTYRLEPRAG